MSTFPQCKKQKICNLIVIEPFNIDYSYYNSELHQLMINFDEKTNNFENTKFYKDVNWILMDGKYNFIIPSDKICDIIFRPYEKNNLPIDSFEQINSILTNNLELSESICPEKIIKQIIKHIESLFFWNTYEMPELYIKLIQTHTNLFQNYIQKNYTELDMEVCEYKKIIELIRFIENMNGGLCEFSTDKKIIELMSKSTCFQISLIMLCCIHNHDVNNFKYLLEKLITDVTMCNEYKIELLDIVIEKIVSLENFDLIKLFKKKQYLIEAVFDKIIPLKKNILLNQFNLIQIIKYSQWIPNRDELLYFITNYKNDLTIYKNDLAINKKDLTINLSNAIENIIGTNSMYQNTLKYLGEIGYMFNWSLLLYALRGNTSCLNIIMYYYIFKNQNEFEQFVNLVLMWNNCKKSINIIDYLFKIKNFPITIDLIKIAIKHKNFYCFRFFCEQFSDIYDNLNLLAFCCVKNNNQLLDFYDGIMLLRQKYNFDIRNVKFIKFIIENKCIYCFKYIYSKCPNTFLTNPTMFIHIFQNDFMTGFVNLIKYLNLKFDNKYIFPLDAIIFIVSTNNIKYLKLLDKYNYNYQNYVNMLSRCVEHNFIIGLEYLLNESTFRKLNITELTILLNLATDLNKTQIHTIIYNKLQLIQLI